MKISKKTLNRAKKIPFLFKKGFTNFFTNSLLSFLQMWYSKYTTNNPNNIDNRIVINIGLIFMKKEPIHIATSYLIKCILQSI